jgi:hypothetical protein
MAATTAAAAAARASLAWCEGPLPVGVPAAARTQLSGYEAERLRKQAAGLLLAVACLKCALHARHAGVAVPVLLPPAASTTKLWARTGMGLSPRVRWQLPVQQHPAA